MRMLDCVVLGLIVLGSCSGSTTEGGERPDGVLAALVDAVRVEILALHPYPYQLEEDGEELEQFHGYGILGRVSLGSQADGNELIALIERGIEASNGMVAACFNPRHGLQLTVDGAIWDILICYECLSMQVYRNGKKQNGYRTAELIEPRASAIYRAAGLVIHGNDGD